MSESVWARNEGAEVDNELLGAHLDLEPVHLELVRLVLVRVQLVLGRRHGGHAHPVGVAPMGKPEVGNESATVGRQEILG